MTVLLLLQDYGDQGQRDCINPQTHIQNIIQDRMIQILSKEEGGKGIDKIIRERQGRPRTTPFGCSREGRMDDDDALFSQTEKECENADWLNDL